MSLYACHKNEENLRSEQSVKSQILYYYIFMSNFGLGKYILELICKQHKVHKQYQLKSLHTHLATFTNNTHGFYITNS